MVATLRPLKTLVRAPSQNWQCIMCLIAGLWSSPKQPPLGVLRHVEKHVLHLSCWGMSHCFPQADDHFRHGKICSNWQLRRCVCLCHAWFHRRNWPNKPAFWSSSVGHAHNTNSASRREEGEGEGTLNFLHVSGVFQFASMDHCAKQGRQRCCWIRNHLLWWDRRRKEFSSLMEPHRQIWRGVWNFKTSSFSWQPRLYRVDEYTVSQQGAEDGLGHIGQLEDHAQSLVPGPACVGEIPKCTCGKRWYQTENATAVSRHVLNATLSMNRVPNYYFSNVILPICIITDSKCFFIFYSPIWCVFSSINYLDVSAHSSCLQVCSRTDGASDRLRHHSRQVRDAMFHFSQLRRGRELFGIPVPTYLWAWGHDWVVLCLVAFGCSTFVSDSCSSRLLDEVLTADLAGNLISVTGDDLEDGTDYHQIAKLSDDEDAFSGEGTSQYAESSEWTAWSFYHKFLKALALSSFLKDQLELLQAISNETACLNCFMPLVHQRNDTQAYRH